jgi:hypothetical protein
MTDDSNIIIPNFPPLLCNEIIYRLPRNKGWIDRKTYKVSPGAFLLRKHLNEIGVSVNISTLPKDCMERFKCEDLLSLARKFGCKEIISLHVGRVRDLGLDVIQDRLNHANITGLTYKEDDPAEVERLTGFLAKQSRIILI